MQVISVTEAQANLAGLISQTALSHEPVHIASESEQAVLLAESDWRAMQETLHLVAIPGMRESIREGMAMPLDECSKTLDC